MPSILFTAVSTACLFSLIFLNAFPTGICFKLLCQPAPSPTMSINPAPSSSSSYPPPFIVESTLHVCRDSFVLLHGTSSQGQPFGEGLLAPFISPSSGNTTSLPELLPGTEFIFPTGKLRSTTVFGGIETNAWFDVADFSNRTIGEDKQIEGLGESSTYLGELIRNEVRERREVNGEDRWELVFGGLSMGCAMGGILLLSGELERLGVIGKVAAFVGLSGWLPFRKQIEEVARTGEGWLEKRRNVRKWVRALLGLGEWEGVEVEEDVEVWLGHGKNDTKVQLEWGMQMRDVLEMVGYKVSWNEYDGLDHWYSPKELEDLVVFSKGVLEEL